MAKSSKKKQVKKVVKVQENVTDLNAFFDKYMWLVIPILTIVYFITSKYSIGFYQDDEIAQYVNMLEFWHVPALILGNAPKPGYKILMVLPALISYDTVLIVNSLIASLTVYLSYFLIKAYKINYAYFGAFILATQPLFFDLSFRSYPEIFTALLVVCFSLLWKKEKYIYAGLVLGYIYTIRQEYALLIIVMAILFFRRKAYIAILSMGVFPLLYNLLGFMKTGDILFIYSEMQKVSGYLTNSQGVDHYFKMYIFIIGPVCFTLFFLGYLGFLGYSNKAKEYFMSYLIPYLIFTFVFLTHVFTMLNDGPNPGNWRYLLHISPIAALFATKGLDNLADITFKRTGLIIMGIVGFVVLIFLSKGTNGFIMTEETEYSKFLIVISILVLSLILWKNSKTKYLNNMSLILVGLSIVYLFINFEPKKLSTENVTVKDVATYVDGNYQLDGERQLLTNHALFRFYSGLFKDNVGKFKPLQSGTLGEAPPGTILVWESHYGYRPEPAWGNDVSLDMLQQDTTSYKFIKQFISPDQRFGAFIFEKK